MRYHLFPVVPVIVAFGCGCDRTFEWGPLNFGRSTSDRAEMSIHMDAYYSGGPSTYRAVLKHDGSGYGSFLHEFVVLQLRRDAGHKLTLEDGSFLRTSEPPEQEELLELRKLRFSAFSGRLDADGTLILTYDGPVDPEDSLRFAVAAKPDRETAESLLQRVEPLLTRTPFYSAHSRAADGAPCE